MALRISKNFLFTQQYILLHRLLRRTLVRLEFYSAKKHFGEMKIFITHKPQRPCHRTKLLMRNCRQGIS